MSGNKDVLTITGEIVSNYVSKNTLAISEVTKFTEELFNKLSALGGGFVSPIPGGDVHRAPANVSAVMTPAVPVDQSVTDDYIICLDDGMKLKTLRRHLDTLGMTPEQYRQKWNLPPDYPMVAKNYADSRREFAKKIGLSNRRQRKKPGPKPGSKRPKTGAK